ncbi:hypothetical protein [Methylocapsa aurea]|uniref:hypothetical protein n=1 Tax=Methylocapsa aurea TaxID=663610 RepID=UPI00055E5118|nr:hypothetical protein [Methylocapsa aurea]
MIQHSAAVERARGETRVLALVVAAGLSAAILSFASLSLASRADAASGAELADFGVACSIGAPPWAPPITAETLPWRSVWFGHFSGGRPFAGPYGQALVDWRDEKVCFPTRASCRAWIHELRRAYHRPEGYWTCLLLR